MPQDVTLGDGAVVTYELVAQGHSSFEGGRSELSKTYRFSAPGHQETAEVTIILSIGGQEAP